MPSIIPPQPTEQTDAHLTCPTCGQRPAQRIDESIGDDTLASCVCARGHLFTYRWMTHG